SRCTGPTAMAPSASKGRATGSRWRPMPRSGGRGCAPADRDGPVTAPPGSRLGRVPTFKPAYLIHGEEHGRISERRARLRALAEAESGTGGVEVFEGDAATPETVALALCAMTFAIGRRFLIVDGVERWKDADIESTLAPVMAGIAPDTTVAFFAREEGRTKVSPKLVAAVKQAGGDVDTETALKPRELPKWVVAEGARLGVKVEGAAAQAAERQIWGLVDAMVGGDRALATRAFLELRAQGETLPRLVPLMARRIREVLAIAVRLEAGESPAQLKSSLKMSPWLADRRIKEARGTDVESLQRALEELAELELASRGN